MLILHRTRYRLRLDLALRLSATMLAQHLRSLTASPNRIRKLYHSYIADAGRRDVRRHRGMSPRQTAFFMRNAAIRREAAGLATLLCILGLLRREKFVAPGTVDHLRWGERFCEAYETFVSLNGTPQLSFDHACHLLRSLEKQNEICLDDCEGCGACSSSCAARNGEGCNSALEPAADGRNGRMPSYSTFHLGRHFGICPRLLRRTRLRRWNVRRRKALKAAAAHLSMGSVTGS